MTQDQAELKPCAHCGVAHSDGDCPVDTPNTRPGDAQAEIERLTKEITRVRQQACDQLHRADTAEAEAARLRELLDLAEDRIAAHDGHDDLLATTIREALSASPNPVAEVVAALQRSTYQISECHGPSKTYRYAFGFNSLEDVHALSGAVTRLGGAQQEGKSDGAEHPAPND